MNTVYKWSGVALLLSAQGAGADPVNGGYGFDHHMFWGYGMFGGFGMLLFWGLVIASVVLIFRFLNPDSRRTNSSDAIDTLKRRFANGEIDEEEYTRRKRILEEQ